MFWKKNPISDLKKILAPLVPDPVISLATLGLDGVLQETLIDFVFVLIEEEDVHQFGILMSKVIQTAIDSRAMVVANTGGLVQLVTNQCGDLAAPDHRLALARDLVGKTGAKARIVHGRAWAHVGAVGTPDRKTWGVFPVRIVRVMHALLDVAPGELVDLGSET